MKKYNVIIIAVMIVMLVLLAGCGGEGAEKGGKTKELSASAEEVASYLAENITFQDFLDALDKDLFLSIYDLPEEVVKDSFAYVSTGATAEEIAVVYAYDEDGAKAIKEAFESRIAAQKEGFENYVPEELTKLEKPVICQIQNEMLILVICDDDKEAQGAIDDFMKTIAAK